MSEIKKVTIKLEQDAYDLYRIAGQLGSQHTVDEELAKRMVDSRHAVIVKNDAK
jgi:hypothetical protein